MGKTLWVLVVMTTGVGSCAVHAEDRVGEARERVEQSLREQTAAIGVAYPPKAVLLRAFKADGEVELWVGDTPGGRLSLLKTYPICASSGDLGPKRKRGDAQVPEGFYVVDRYNPKSSYHLSLGLNYPNASDRIRGRRKADGTRFRGNLGGDIFVHGDCVTIGCIPLTDALIEEVYVLAWDAKRVNGAKTDVHIFPFRFNDANETRIRLVRPDITAHATLWAELKEGAEAFDKTQRLPRITVNKKGAYVVKAR